MARRFPSMEFGFNTMLSSGGDREGKTGSTSGKGLYVALRSARLPPGAASRPGSVGSRRAHDGRARARGLLRVLGATEAAALAEEQEQLGRSGRLDGAPDLLARLESEVARVLSAAAALGTSSGN
jgi:hypothetical protein